MDKSSKYGGFVVINPKLMLDKVLFVIPLRVGNIVMGLTAALFYLLLFICVAKEYIWNFEKSYKQYNLLPTISTWTTLGHSFACVLFVVGILKRKPRLLLPWLFSHLVVTLYLLLFAIDWRLLPMFNFIVFQGYIWLCAYSMYQRGFNVKLSTSSNNFEDAEDTVLRKVFYIFPLRIGNIFIGLMGACFYFGLGLYLIIVNAVLLEKRYFIVMVLISLALVHTIACLIFATGVIKNNRICVLPWLVSHVLVTVAVAILFIECESFDVNYYLFVLIWIGFQVYIWLCGFSVYQSRILRAAGIKSVLPSESDGIRQTVALKYQQLDIIPNLIILKNVLFFVPLDIGNMVMGFGGAVLYLIMGIASIKKMCTYYTYFPNAAPYYFIENTYYSFYGNFSDLSMTSFCLIHSVPCMIFGFGILKKKQQMLMPWLFSQMFITFGPVTAYFILRPPLVQEVTLALNWIALQIYIWLCGYSNYHRIIITSSVEHNNTLLKYDGNESCSGILTSNKFLNFDLLPNVMPFDKILYCIPLRIGNIVLGLFGVFFSMVTCISFIILSRTDVPFSAKLYYRSMIGVSLVHSVVCLYFVVGVLKMRKLMLLPWMTSHILITFLLVINFFIQKSYMWNQNVNILIIWVLFQCYIWLTGFSVYKRTPERGAEYEFIPSTKSETFGETLFSTMHQELNLFPALNIFFSDVFCFIPLRIENIVLGFTGAIVYLVLAINFILNISSSSKNFSQQFFFVSFISVFLIHSIMCIVFVVSILKKNHRMLIPWLFSQILIAIVPVVVAFLDRTITQVNILMPFCWILVQAYIWFCGYSFYQRSITLDG